MVRAAGVEPAQPLAGGLQPRGLADAQDADGWLPREDSNLRAPVNGRASYR